MLQADRAVQPTPVPIQLVVQVILLLIAPIPQQEQQTLALVVVAAGLTEQPTEETVDLAWSSLDTQEHSVAQVALSQVQVVTPYTHLPHQELTQLKDYNNTWP